MEGHHEHENDQTPEYLVTDIPPLFHSDSSGEPLSHCMVCETELLESGMPYLIEKTYKRYNPEMETANTLFEFVCCVNCAMQMRAELSTQSLAAMERYMQENANLESRREELLGNPNAEMKDWISTCMIKDKAMRDLDEYKICGQFQHDKMICSEMPYLIGGAAMDEMMELLSPETLDELNGFTERFAGGPPELAELLDRPLLVI